MLKFVVQTWVRPIKNGVTVRDTLNRAEITGNVFFATHGFYKKQLILFKNWDFSVELNLIFSTNYNPPKLFTVLTVTDGDNYILKFQIRHNGKSHALFNYRNQADFGVELQIGKFNAVSIRQYDVDFQYFLSMDINGENVYHVIIENPIEFPIVNLIYDSAELTDQENGEMIEVQNIFFQVFETGTKPIKCEIGFFAKEEGMSECLECPRGMVCPARGTFDPFVCPDGTIQNGMSCVECPAGFSCYNNTQNICPAGAYCESGSANYTVCPTSTFNIFTQSANSSECLRLPNYSECLRGHLPDIENCFCLPGFNGNVTSECKNIDECVDSTTCGDKEHCIDTVGSFRCSSMVSLILEENSCKENSADVCRLGDYTLIPIIRAMELMAAPINETILKNRNQSENEKDLSRRSDDISPVVKRLNYIKYQKVNKSITDPMLRKLERTNINKIQHTRRFDYQKINNLLSKLIENSAKLVNHSASDEEFGQDKFMFYQKSAKRQTRQETEYEIVAVGENKIRIRRDSNVIICTMKDNNLKTQKMSDQPLVHLRLEDSEEFTVFSKNGFEPEEMEKVIGTTKMEIIRLEPAPETELFVWLGPMENVLITAYIGYNIIPIPDQLVYEFKIDLPTTDFDSSFSTAHCTNPPCILESPEGFVGNGYGIFLPRKEIQLCAIENRKCVVFIALKMVNVIPGTIKTNISTLITDCKTESGNGEWKSKECQIIPFETNSSFTVCKCSKSGKDQKLNLASDIFVPPRSIDFDQIFINGCETCAYSIIFFGVTILGIWLATFIWSSVSLHFWSKPFFLQSRRINRYLVNRYVFRFFGKFWKIIN